MKKAFTLIELIVSIVIMGIAISTVPLLTQNSSKNIELILQQEAILLLKSRITQIMSADWDPSSYNVADGYVRYIKTSGDSKIEIRDAGDNIASRKGLADLSEASTQRKQNVDAINRGAFQNITASGDDYYSITHFNNEKSDIKKTPENYDYVFETELRSEIYFINDSANYESSEFDFTFTDSESLSSTSNVKMIKVTADLKGVEAGKKIVLRAYSSNIGESRLGRKAWR